LLSTIAAILSELGLNVTSARIGKLSSTRALDVFSVTAQPAQPGLPSHGSAAQLRTLIKQRLQQAHADSAHLAAMARTADILIVAIGSPELVRCAASHTTWSTTGFILAQSV
jgi:Tetrahydrofolate dehydrogenase/cyclohydrolase, NAD(P)-binding domain